MKRNRYEKKRQVPTAVEVDKLYRACEEAYEAAMFEKPSEKEKWAALYADFNGVAADAMGVKEGRTFRAKSYDITWRYTDGAYEVDCRGGDKCRFRIIRSGRGFVTIRGVDGKSVTNAAEEVVEVLLALNGFKRFFYYESDGGLWELCHDGKRFTAFQEASMYQGECG